MKEEIKYAPPRVEIVEVEIEKGFAVSGQGQDTDGDYEFGGRS